MPWIPRMPDRGPRLLLLPLLVVLFSIAGTARGAAGTTKAPFDPGVQVLRLTQRINGIIQSVLDLERNILFRIERKRPIDWERMVSRLASARRQIRALRRMALRLEPSIPAGHPARAQIQSLRSQLRNALALHRQQGAKILAGGGEACRQALEQVDAVCDDPQPASGTVPFPVQSLDDQF